MALAALVIAPCALGAADPPYAAGIEAGRAALREMIAQGRAAGAAAAVAVGGEVVWEEGCGWADLEHRVPAGADTLFGIGSISKSLTMTAAVKLAARGVIDLDAPLERYLPDFPHPGRGVTIRRVAAHQGGLDDGFAAAHYQTARHFATVESAYLAMREAPLEYEPGTRTVYATGTYTFVGRALERAAGRSFLEILREEVLAPAGLGIVPDDRRAPVPRRTRFYAEGEGGGFEPAPFTDPSHKLPGAGLLATAGDLARFGSALLDSAFLGERARRDLFTPVPLRDGTRTEFSPGFRVSADERGAVVHQPGGGLGISSWIFIHPEERLVVAVVANVATAPVADVHREIIAALRR